MADGGYNTSLLACWAPTPAWSAITHSFACVFTKCPWKDSRRFACQISQHPLAVSRIASCSCTYYGQYWASSKIRTCEIVAPQAATWSSCLTVSIERLKYSDTPHSLFFSLCLYLRFLLPQISAEKCLQLWSLPLSRLLVFRGSPMCLRRASKLTDSVLGSLSTKYTPLTLYPLMLSLDTFRPRPPTNCALCAFQSA